ncbi:unnamed protein product [Symbiodinium sp. CCMP2592]|nr:unnamed protein product [Symbiodinium sp. CCMP2592]
MDQSDVRPVAEPEMEVDGGQTEGEPEPDEEMMQSDEDEEAANELAHLLNYSRKGFDPSTYLNTNSNQRVELKQMHYVCVCVGVLSDIIPKLTGYQLFSLIRPAPSGPVGFLFIDPVGVMANVSLGDVSVTTIGMLIDSDTPVPRKYLDKFIKNRAFSANRQRYIANTAADKGTGKNRRPAEREQVSIYTVLSASHADNNIQVRLIHRLTEEDVKHFKICAPPTICKQDDHRSWMPPSQMNNVNVSIVQITIELHHPDEETAVVLGMPTPMSTRAEAQASPRLLRNVSVNVNVSGAGRKTIGHIVSFTAGKFVALVKDLFDAEAIDVQAVEGGESVAEGGEHELGVEGRVRLNSIQCELYGGAFREAASAELSKVKQTLAAAFEAIDVNEDDMVSREACCKVLRWCVHERFPRSLQGATESKSFALTNRQEEPLLSTRGDEVFAAEAQFAFDVLLCSTGGTWKVEHDVAGQSVEDLVAAAGRPDRHVDCKGPSVLGFVKSRQARPRPKRCHKAARRWSVLLAQRLVSLRRHFPPSRGNFWRRSEPGIRHCDRLPLPPQRLWLQRWAAIGGSGPLRSRGSRRLCFRKSHCFPLEGTRWNTMSRGSLWKTLLLPQARPRPKRCHKAAARLLGRLDAGFWGAPAGAERLLVKPAVRDRPKMGRPPQRRSEQVLLLGQMV